MNMSDELRFSPKRTQSAGEELANSISHGIGLCAALIGGPILLLEARRSSPSFFFGHGDFYGHAVDVVSRIHALPCMAANARENYFADAGSFGDFFVDCRDIHAVYARPASRVVGFHHARARLGARHFRCDLESDPRRIARSETGDDALSWYWMVGADRGSPDHAGDSLSRTILAGGRWRRLYHWCALFRERTSALQPLHLAFVRPSRFELSFSRDSLLLRDLRGASGFDRSDFSCSASGDWTRGIDGRINSHAAGGARRSHQRKDSRDFGG